MANPYDSTDPLTQKKWAKYTWQRARIADSLLDPKNGFVGTSKEAYRQKPIVEISDFEAGPGDEITIPMATGIGGRGTTGSEQLEGKERTQGHVPFKFKVDVQRQAVKTLGLFQNVQRVPFDTMDEASASIVDWVKERRSVAVTNHMAGNSRVVDVAYSGMNAVLEPDTKHIYRINQGLGLSNDQTVGADTTAKFDMPICDKLLNIAESLSPMLRPFIIEGNPYYGMFLHPNVIRDLHDSGTRWYAEAIAALQGGAIQNNPIFSRALGKHQNVLLFRDPYIPQGKNSSTGAAVANTRRCYFTGAGAVIMGYGVVSRGGDKDHLKWHSMLMDYGARYGVAATFNWGVKAIRFKTPSGVERDHGRIVVTAYAADEMAYEHELDDGTYFESYDLGQPQP